MSAACQFAVGDEVLLRDGRRMKIARIDGEYLEFYDPCEDCDCDPYKTTHRDFVQRASH